MQKFEVRVKSKIYSRIEKQKALGLDVSLPAYFFPYHYV